MNRERIVTLFLSAALAGCAGGGIDANQAGSAGSTKFASDALVQALPYEVVRNTVISAFSLTSVSPAIVLLDQNKVTFGAQTQAGTPRKLDLSLARMRSYTQVCDLAVSEGMKNIPDQLFDTKDPLSPDKICRRILGRPITDEHRAALDKLVALGGYASQIQKQHAIGLACCSMIEAQVQ